MAFLDEMINSYTACKGNEISEWFWREALCWSGGSSSLEYMARISLPADFWSLLATTLLLTESALGPCPVPGQGTHMSRLTTTSILKGQAGCLGGNGRKGYEKQKQTHEDHLSRGSRGRATRLKERRGEPAEAPASRGAASPRLRALAKAVPAFWTSLSSFIKWDCHSRLVWLTYVNHKGDATQFL